MHLEPVSIFYKMEIKDWYRSTNVIHGFATLYRHSPSPPLVEARYYVNTTWFAGSLEMAIWRNDPNRNRRRFDM